MLGSMVNCVKALNGLDGEDYDDKNFQMCETNCLCSESTTESICTSPNIVQQFCPADRYEVEPLTAATTTSIDHLTNSQTRCWTNPLHRAPL